MLAKLVRSIFLTHEPSSVINAKSVYGHDRSASEVVCASLRPLNEQERASNTPSMTERDGQ